MMRRAAALLRRVAERLDPTPVAPPRRIPGNESVRATAMASFYEQRGTFEGFEYAVWLERLIVVLASVREFDDLRKQQRAVLTLFGKKAGKIHP